MHRNKCIYALHLESRFGTMRLDEITVSEVARFRAELVGQGLGEKRINNILAVLSKPLRYAVDCEMIAKAPKIGLFKVERPEIVAWDFAQYARLLAAAKTEGEDWYAAVCLAGEAGLRVGEVKALRWREDIDLIARTITVNQQTCRGETGTPKGRTLTCAHRLQLTIAPATRSRRAASESDCSSFIRSDPTGSVRIRWSVVTLGATISRRGTLSRARVDLCHGRPRQEAPRRAVEAPGRRTFRGRRGTTGQPRSRARGGFG